MRNSTSTSPSSSSAARAPFSAIFQNSKALLETNATLSLFDLLPHAGSTARTAGTTSRTSQRRDFMAQLFSGRCRGTDARENHSLENIRKRNESKRIGRNQLSTGIALLP